MNEPRCYLFQPSGADTKQTIFLDARPEFPEVKSNVNSRQSIREEAKTIHGAEE